MCREVLLETVSSFKIVSCLYVLCVGLRMNDDDDSILLIENGV